MNFATSENSFATLTRIFASVAVGLVVICLIWDVVAAVANLTIRNNLLEITRVLLSIPAVAGGFALVFHKPIATRIAGVLPRKTD